MNGVASAKHYKGEFVEAEKYYRDSLAMLERIHGLDHPAVANATHAVAAIVMAHHPPDESEAMYRKALDRYQKLYGDEHLATVDCMSDLAVILKNREANEEAEPLYKQVLEVRRKVLGSSLSSMKLVRCPSERPTSRSSPSPKNTRHHALKTDDDGAPCCTADPFGRPASVCCQVSPQKRAEYGGKPLATPP